MIQLAATSREFVYCKNIQAFDANSPDSAVDPSTLVVKFAFTLVDAEPGILDWKAGQWGSSTSARILVGPGGAITLTPGEYAIWIQILGATEQPARPIGHVTIY